MYSIASRATRILPFLTAIFLYLFTVQAAAEIELQTQIGFRGVFRLGQPFPLTVELINSGRPVEGTLEVEVSKGGPSKGIAAYSVIHRREVFLAAHSHKRVIFTVDPDSVARPLAVRFSNHGETLFREVDLRGHFSPSSLILLLTENMVSPALPLLSDSPVPVISLSLDELPSDGRAYQGVWAVLFYEQSLRDLSRSQQAALETWLAWGGRILVLGGLHYALYQEPSISRFLPVRVMGLKKLATLPSTERAYGGSGSRLRDLLVQDSRFVEGNVLVSEGGTPILVEMTRGDGRVFYLSLDVGRPPISHWEGLPRIFADLLGSPPERGVGLWVAWDDSVFSRLLMDRSFLGTYSPLVPFLISLLLYGCGLVFLLRLWQQQRFARSVLAGSFLLFVVLITVAGYFFFDRGVHMPDGILVSSTILDGGAAGSAEVQSNVGLFSTRRRQYSFRIEKAWNDLETPPPRSAKSKGAPVVIRDGIDATLLRFPLKEWEYRLFRIRSLDTFPVRIEAETSDNRLSLRLSNLSRTELSHCWLVISGKGLSLGHVAPGASLLREIALSPDGQFVDGQEEKGLWEIPFTDRMREALFRYSIFPQGQALGRSEAHTAFVIGWVRGESGRISVRDRRILVRDYTLFRAPLALGREDEL